MFILRSVIIWFLITTGINAYLMSLPMLVLRKRAYPARYVIEQSNRIDFQSNVECAAFSTAYLLRHFGVEEKGDALYTVFPSKTKSGTVYPKGIRTVLKQKGFQTNYYKGTIHTLKYEVSKGTPVIANIKVNMNKHDLHFVPVVGYDEEYIYLSESLKHLANVEENGFNRKIPIAEFKKLWDIKRLHFPIYSNTYITVEPKREIL